MSKQRTELIDPKQFASEIRDHHEACIGSGNDALQHAKEAGQLLTELKKSKSVPHGEWSGWVEANCCFAVRTAQRYMQIAEKWSLIEEARKASRGTLLALRDARELIAKPKPEKKTAPKSRTSPTPSKKTDPPKPADPVDVSGWDDPEPTPVDPAVSFYDGDPEENGEWQVPSLKESAMPFDILLRELSEWEKRVTANLIESDDPGTAFLDRKMESEFKMRVNNIRELIKGSRPYSICADCMGQRCKTCRQSGLVPRRFTETMGMKKVTA